MNKIEFTRIEFDTLAFALKSRLALIEMKALSMNGETPDSFRNALDSDEEYKALRSLIRKFEID
jgi:hypothetical protein